jgi:glycosyltransferase involved in cell wall biosynthesis
MKIALVSTGLGRVYRGFESFTGSLFQALRWQAPHIDVTLFQGGGKSEGGRIVVPNFHRNDIPAVWFGYERGSLLEKRSFALALYPFLRLGQYDIVHYNELVMGSALYHLRRYFGGKFKLLYCNGAPSPPMHYHHRCDFAQLLTGPAFSDAIKFNLSEDRLFLLPYGVNGERFSPANRKAYSEIRQELGIPEKAKVILTVAALNRDHKRIDYLIKEISRIDSSIWLLAAGQRSGETACLEKEAEELMPGRWCFVSWPHDRVPLLFATADFFVLTSTLEGFGLVIIEAMLSGLPVIIHNGPVFQWIARGTSARLIDMSAEGALQQCLRDALSIESHPNSRDAAMEKFSWKALIPQYLNMYEQVMTTHWLQIQG